MGATEIDPADEPEDEDDEFKVWAAGQPTSRNYLGLKGATLKRGEQVCKTVQIGLYGDPETGEVSKRELRFKSLPRRLGAPGFDFDHPTVQWFCENKEIDKLLAFLKDEVDQPGRYRHRRGVACPGPRPTC